MRKLLALFGSLTLVGTTPVLTGSVVACGVEQLPAGDILLPLMDLTVGPDLSNPATMLDKPTQMSFWYQIYAALIVPTLNEDGTPGEATMDTLGTAGTVYGAARLYAAPDWSSVKQMMWKAVYNNAIMIKYMVMTCGGDSAKIDSAYAKQLNLSLESYEYTIMDETFQPMTEQFKIVISADKTPDGDASVPLTIIGEDAEKSLQGEDAKAAYIVVDDGKDGATIALLPKDIN